MAKIKILIADDHAVVRQGFCKLLEQEPDLEVVAEAGDGEETVRLVTDLSPDVAIIDIAMPILDGIEATRLIKERCPDTRVLILSAYDDSQFIFSLLEAGASGYLLKGVHGKELVAAIRAIHEGESVFHPSITRKVLSHFIQKSSKPGGQNSIGVLSEREVEVLRLMSRGMSNKEIAASLHLSTRTVQGYMSQIFHKLGVNSRTEALTLALKEGWVTLDDMGQHGTLRIPTV